MNLVDNTGTPIASDTGLKVTFCFPQWFVPQTLASGQVRIRRGMAQVNFNKMGNPTANIWTASIMPEISP